MGGKRTKNSAVLIYSYNLLVTMEVSMSRKVDWLI